MMKMLIKHVVAVVQLLFMMLAGNYSVVHLVIFVVVVVYDDDVKMIEGAMFHEGGTGKYWPMRWPASEKMVMMMI